MSAECQECNETWITFVFSVKQAVRSTKITHTQREREECLSLHVTAFDNNSEIQAFYTLVGVYLCVMCVRTCVCVCACACVCVLCVLQYNSIHSPKRKHSQSDFASGRYYLHTHTHTHSQSVGAGWFQQTLPASPRCSTLYPQ